VDGLTGADVESRIGVPGFLDDLRAQLKAGMFRPLPVREKKIPKPGGAGRVRRLKIPVIADRVVQAALKLVLEPIFEADFKPVSYGFRPQRRAQDAIAEIQHMGTHGYRWVLDAGIAACFDEIDHTALMDRVRARIKDKKVLSLVKAFLKAGVLTELGELEGTPTGTPQGGIMSPLMANIALSVLDEYLHGPWEAGARSHLRDVVRPCAPRVWRPGASSATPTISSHWSTAPRNTSISCAKRSLSATTYGTAAIRSQDPVVHMSEGFDFLGFHVRWRRKRGTSTWHVYTFISDRAIHQVKAKIRALTCKTSPLDLDAVLAQLNMARGGWAFHFQHAIAESVFSKLDTYTWWRVARLLRERHRWSWKELRRRHTTPTGRWLPFTANGVELRRIESIPVTRYLYQGNKIPTPWAPAAC
jgi:RNA-directed DNA polymerase